MYDILQLNDMLVPELLDMASELKIPQPKKADKQELIYKILDKQAIMTSAEKTNDGEKPKRKRIVKTATANSTEEAEVMQESPKAESKEAAPAEPKVEKVKAHAPAHEKKKPSKKAVSGKWRKKIQQIIMRMES